MSAATHKNNIPSSSYIENIFFYIFFEMVTQWVATIPYGAKMKHADFSTLTHL